MALEGTKQAAHLWQKNLNEFMIEYGFERCVVDPCLYKYVVGGSGSILICAVHVDDVLCGYNDANSMDDFEKAFAKRFNASRVGASTYLGAEITRDRDARTITMTQRVYIEKMASKYLVGGNTKKWTTPIDMSREGGAKFLALTVADGEREINEMSARRPVKHVRCTKLAQRCLQLQPGLRARLCGAVENAHATPRPVADELPVLRFVDLQEWDEA